MPVSGNHCDYMARVCLSHLADDLEPSPFMDSQMTLHSLILFNMGPWEYSEMHACVSRESGRRNSTETIIQNLINLVDKYPHIKFVWRTWAGPGSSRLGKKAFNYWQNAQAHNHLIKTLIHKFQKERYAKNDTAWTRITYVDWGQVMGERVFPEERRIKGDIDNHFGFEARSAFVQMWLNHLVELERQEKLHLAPGWSLMDARDTDTANDCSQAGGSPTYCLDQEELVSHYENFLTISQPSTLTKTEEEDYRHAKRDFNATGIFAQGINCEHRLSYCA